MPGSDQPAEFALRYLGEMSADIRASVIVDPGGRVSASEGISGDDAERMAALATGLFDAAAEAAPDGAAQVEIATETGAVFAVRQDGFTIAAVTGRLALPSLTFYDLRHVLSDLGAKAA